MLKPGSVLQDRYVVVGEIGSGGMATVYAADDRQIPGTRVAIKEMRLLLDDASQSAAAVEQFQREAQILRALKHDRIPRVYSWFEQDGRYYLVMDLVEGKSLDAVVGAMPADARATREHVSRVLQWGTQIADTLRFLHTQSPPVIYKDLKPENLMLTPDGNIVLLDFGIAKALDHRGSYQTAVKGMGSPGFAAPEQYSEEAVTDPRADLYALGATLYALMAGTAPVDGISRSQALLDGQPDPLVPLTKQNAAVTPGVEAVVSRLLAVRRPERFASAEEARKALTELDAQPDAPSPPAQSTASPLQPRQAYQAYFETQPFQSKLLKTGFRVVLVWLAILFVAYLGVSVMVKSSASVRPLSFTEFEQELERHNVDFVTMDDRQIRGTLKTPAGTRFRTEYLAADTSRILEALREQGIDVEVSHGEPKTWWMFALDFIPYVMLFAFFVLIMRRAQSAARTPVRLVVMTEDEADSKVSR